MYLYEQSIIKDINNLFINSKVKAVVADSLDEGLRRIAAECEDKITLPVIVLSGGNWTVDDANFYSLMHGSEIKRIEDNTLAKNMSILPITPSYNMYVIAQSSRECDMLTREMLFHYFTHPTLTIRQTAKIATKTTRLFLIERSKSTEPAPLSFPTAAKRLRSFFK